MAASLLRPLRQAFGLEHISDDLVASCASRVATRCSRVDLTAYRRKQGQAALEVAAREAIVGAFKDHHPDRAHKFLINGHWPYAHALIRGNKAWIEISIGIDYEDPDEGLDVIEIQVDRHPKQVTIREKFEDFLLNREPRKTAKEPVPLELVRKVAPAEPAPTGRPIDPPKPRAKVSRPTVAKK